MEQSRIGIERQLLTVRQATVRFAGDSGDGMQLVGGQFADIASQLGNIIRSMPDFPSEIRAPAGSLAGVSGYQLTFADAEIATPGDAPFVLVAMNPAALRVSLPELQPGGIVIANQDEFTPANLGKAHYAANPLQDGSLETYHVIPVPMAQLNDEATIDSALSKRERARCRNFFALGIVLWLYYRPLEPLLEWVGKKFRKTPELMAGNEASLRAGYEYANVTDAFRIHFHVPPARLPQGRYRRVTGNEALALGCIAAAHQAARPLFYATYPITPASEILHELSRHKNFDVRTFQCEDEIAACCAAIGGSYAGAIGVTGTSGPGLALKTEPLGLAVMTELPLVVINVQRAGPSTGLPTKTEQADLLMALYGRHGESPLVVLAAATPADCFPMAVEAVRLATRYMTPVVLLSDSFLANSAETFAVPDPEQLPDLRIPSPTETTGFAAYRRDPRTLARPWAVPGTAGLEHRIGGLEKQDVTGLVSYDAKNHQHMVELRARKIAGMAEDLPLARVEGAPTGDLLVVGWGSTYGAISMAVKQAVAEGHTVSHLHLRYLNPLPRNVGDILRGFRRVAAPENNLGQLSVMLRSQFLVDVKSWPKVEGRPFLIRDIRNAIEATLRHE